MLTLTAISVDRLLALLLRLRYRQVVTSKRTYVIVVTSWALPAIFSAMWFWNPSITSFYQIIGIPLCLTISIISYTKIFLHPPSSSKSSRRPCSTTEPNKSAEHSEIQKGSIHCNMAAAGTGRLLSALWCSDGFGDQWWTIFFCF